MPVINIPKVIRDKLGEDGADALVEVFNQIEKNIREDSMIILEEKFEKRLTEGILKLKVELKEDIANLKADTETKISKLEASLRTEIASLRTEIAEAKAFLVRCMFVFWASQIALIITLFSIFKKT